MFKIIKNSNLMTWIYFITKFKKVILTNITPLEILTKLNILKS